ncbi:hypothetical protein MAR_008281 [Mya arenaria]|uniref:Uncharacterized protein n=1 Tax=Mya arenaria TaxID=6604 RepID=A0ABY7DVJ0_MYAAR|nr:hypothetical protein MAR_008281 [Mya arenaria]
MSLTTRCHGLWNDVVDVFTVPRVTPSLHGVVYTVGPRQHCIIKLRRKETKSREKISEKKRNREYQAKYKAKSNVRSDTTYTFKNRMEKCRLLKKIKDVVPGTPTAQRKIFNDLVKENTPHTENGLSEMIVTNVKTRAAINILTASVSGANLIESKYQVHTARKLGQKRWKVTGGYKKRTVYLTSEKACYTATSRKARSDKLTDATKHIIYDAWLSPNNSRTTGNKADVKHFKMTHSNIKISQRCFERLRPFFVQPLRPKDRNTCCCRKHVEAILLFRKCMEYNRKHDRTHLSYEHLTDVVQTTMCPKPANSKYNRIECIRRTCPNCGVHKSPLFSESVPDTQSVNWEKYEYVRVKVKETIDKKKLMMVKKNTSAAEMFDYFRQLLVTYSVFSAHWQQEQLSTLKSSLQMNQCLVIHDISENYRCIEKQELQSTYFGKTEVSMHVSVVYRHAVLEYDHLSEYTIVTEVLYAISPDTTHDHYFVSNVQDRIKHHLDNVGCKVDDMIEFTDGCSCQYKSRTCMGVSTLLCEKHGYKSFERNFFETSHAKGPQDAAGGLLKRQLDIAVMKGESIQSARDVFDFAKENLCTPKSGIYPRRIFACIESTDRSTTYKFSAVPNNKRVHQMSTCCPGTITIRLVITWLRWENLPKLTWGMYRKFIHVTSQVTKATHVLTRDTDDQWGNRFMKGSSVEQGLYFNKNGQTSSHMYTLVNRLKAIVYAEAVIYIVGRPDEKDIQLSECDHLDIIQTASNLQDI